MKPGILTAEMLPFYKGTRWAHTLTLKNRSDKSPVDLTGVGPFTFTITPMKSKTIIGTGTATVDADPETGKIYLVVGTSVTDDLPEGEVRVGLRSANDDPYIVGVCAVRYFPPDS